MTQTKAEINARYYQNHKEERNARVREWKRQNPERAREHTRRKNLRAAYGITPEQYDEMLTAQGGVCAICKQPPGEQYLCVDHDHGCCPTKAKSCGKCLRGLLCGPCNRSLGGFGDDPTTLRVAAAYLEGGFHGDV